jgi:hypothetical protein
MMAQDPFPRRRLNLNFNCRVPWSRCTCEARETSKIQMERDNPHTPTSLINNFF